MLTLYADAEGRLLALVREHEAAFAPADAAHTLTFDEPTNGAALDRLRARWDDLRLVDGVLSLNGQPVPIAPDSPRRTIEERLRAALAESRQIVTVAEAYQPLANDATAAQVRAHLVTHLPRLYEGLARLARHDIGEIRLLLNDLDAAD